MQKISNGCRPIRFTEWLHVSASQGGLLKEMEYGKFSHTSMARPFLPAALCNWFRLSVMPAARCTIVSAWQAGTILVPDTQMRQAIVCVCVWPGTSIT